MLEGGRKSAKIGLEMEVTIGGDAAKSGKNTHLLMIMCVRFKLSREVQTFQKFLSQSGQICLVFSRAVHFSNIFNVTSIESMCIF